MPSNDTENIYATQYGGEGEPIPATKISYDGTGTSIEATNVQGAITEVDTDLQSTKEDVTDIKNELSGTWVKKNLALEKIEIIADGVKSFNTILNELAVSFLSALSALEDDEAIAPKNLFLQGVAWCGIVGCEYFTNESTAFDPVFNRIYYLDSKMVNVYVKFESHADSHEVFVGAYDSTSASVTNELSTVPPEGRKIYIEYEVWKKSLG